MEDKYSIGEREPEWQAFRREAWIYKFSADAKAVVYSIDTPPPTISGKIHIGHIFSYTQAEVVARYNRMLGKNVFYPFGFDDNGLPTERLVEKELGKKGSEFTREEFTTECLRVTDEYRKKFQNLWESLGFSVDRDLAYSTISPEVQKVSQTSFVRLLNRGLIYQKKSPALRCHECQTSIAQAEIDRKEFESVFYDIQFDREDGSPLVIATTRPELLPACVAVFVNPEDERYTALVGTYVTTPLGVKVQIMADAKVDKEKGTGAVMCCTYGDEVDMHRVKTYGLPERIILDHDGKLQNTGDTELDGVYYKKARNIIVDKVAAAGKLVAQKDISHEVGIHERCGTPIEILPLQQYFVKVMDIKEKLISLGEEIDWQPAFMKKRYIEWVESLKRDWCISRQRYFGIPIPVWYSKKTGEMILPTEADLPINPLTDKPSMLPEWHTYDDIMPEADVLDTWATSALTPLINAKFFDATSTLHEKLLPMSLRPQAHDIIRTRAFYTILMSYYHTGKVPFEHIMISWHVLAGKWEKISKSKNNAWATPEELIQKYGADPIRYWACGGGLGKDIVFDEKEIEKGRKLVTKLRNAARFALLNLQDFAPENVDVSQLYETDQWIIYKSQETGEKMKKYFETFNVWTALIEFEKFFWGDFCDNYLEIVKDKISNPWKYPDGEAMKKSAQCGIYVALLHILKLISPILPHISEELYQSYFKAHENQVSIHTHLYTSDLTATEKTAYASLHTDMKLVLTVIELIRKFKTDTWIKYGQESEKLVVSGNAEALSSLQLYVSDLISITRCTAVEFKAGAEELGVEIV